MADYSYFSGCSYNMKIVVKRTCVVWPLLTGGHTVQVELSSCTLSYLASAPFTQSAVRELNHIIRRGARPYNLSTPSFIEQLPWMQCKWTVISRERGQIGGGGRSLSPQPLMSRQNRLCCRRHRLTFSQWTPPWPTCILAVSYGNMSAHISWRADWLCAYSTLPFSGCEVTDHLLAHQTHGSRPHPHSIKHSSICPLS